jgi:hypothetical protein
MAALSHWGPNMELVLRDINIAVYFRSSHLASSRRFGTKQLKSGALPQTLQNSPDPLARDCSQSGKLAFSSGTEGLVTRIGVTWKVSVYSAILTSQSMRPK